MRRSCRFQTLEARLALVAGPLVVTELMYNPAGPSAAEASAGWSEADFEFIELKNVGSEPLPLTNYTISQGAQFTFGALTLGAGQHIVVVKNRAAFEWRNGSGIYVAGEYGDTLSNGGDPLSLKNASGQTTLKFEFDDAWYPVTDGGGYSLVIINPQSPANTWGQAASWRTSSAVGGSPGRAEGPVDASPPSTPQGLTGAPVSPTQVNLTWQASLDVESGVSAYRIYRDGVLLGSTTSVTYTDVAVMPNSSYAYQVSAINASALESARSSSVTISIAPLEGNPAFAPGRLVGSVTGATLNEASGLVASRRNAEVLYVNNDGPGPDLHVINTQGQFLGAVTLAGVSANDWEDIAIGPGPVAGTHYVYLSDTGDNFETRTSIAVHRFAEPTFNAYGGNQNTTLSAGQYSTISLRFPDGPHNAETLLSDPLTGDLFVITKSLTPSRIYRASAASLAQGGLITLGLAGTFDFATPSAGDISPSGREILIRNEDMARLYPRTVGQTIAQALAGTPFSAPVIGTPQEPNGEAIGFDRAGSGYFTISEGESPALYYFHRLTRIPGQVTTAAVVGRRIFYNNSAFDANNPAAHANDDLAIAHDKQALLPGGTASGANYTNYSRGINGVMVDIQNLPAASLTAADFRFKAGNSSATSTWANAPAPTSIVVRRGAGQNGADRVELIWADRALAQTWLQVSVLATTNTGLATPDIFYFGNAIADTGDTTSRALVNATDEIAVRGNATAAGQFAQVDNPFDFDRDRQVNGNDQVLARSNATTLASALKLISVPGGLQASATNDAAALRLHENYAASFVAPVSGAARLPTEPALPVAHSLPATSSGGPTTEKGELPLMPATAWSGRDGLPDQLLDSDESLYDLIAAELAASRR